MQAARLPPKSQHVPQPSSSIDDGEKHPTQQQQEILAGTPVNLVALQTSIDVLQEEVQEARKESHHARYLFLDLQRRVHQFLFGGDAAADAQETSTDASFSGLASQATKLLSTSTTLTQKFEEFERELLKKIDGDNARSEAAMKHIAEEVATEQCGNLATDLRSTLVSFREKIVCLEHRLNTQEELNNTATKKIKQQMHRTSSGFLGRDNQNLLRSEYFTTWKHLAAERKRVGVQRRAAEALMRTATYGRQAVVFHKWIQWYCERKSNQKVQRAKDLCRRASTTLLLQTYFKKWQRCTQVKQQQVATKLILRSTTTGLLKSYFQSWQKAASHKAVRKRQADAARSVLSTTRSGLQRFYFRKWTGLLHHKKEQEKKERVAQVVLRGTVLGTMRVAYSTWMKNSRIQAKTKAAKRRASLQRLATRFLYVAEHTSPSQATKRYFSTWMAFAHQRMLCKVKLLLNSYDQLAATIKGEQLQLLEKAEERHKQHTTTVTDEVRATLTEQQVALAAETGAKTDSLSQQLAKSVGEQAAAMTEMLKEAETRQQAHTATLVNDLQNKTESLVADRTKTLEHRLTNHVQETVTNATSSAGELAMSIRRQQEEAEARQRQHATSVAAEVGEKLTRQQSNLASDLQLKTDAMTHCMSDQNKELEQRLTVHFADSLSKVEDRSQRTMEAQAQTQSSGVETACKELEKHSGRISALEDLLQNRVSCVETDLVLLQTDVANTREELTDFGRRGLIQADDFRDELDDICRAMDAEKEHRDAEKHSIALEVSRISAINDRERDRKLDMLMELQHPLSDHDVLLYLRDWVGEVEERTGKSEAVIQNIVRWIKALEEELKALRIIRPPFK